MRRGISARRRAAHALAVTALALPGLAVVATGAGAETVRTVRAERPWRPFAGQTNVLDSRLALDVAHRVAYVFDSGGGSTRIRAWDLDKLTPRTPVLTEQGMPGVRAQTPIVVDERHRTVTVAPKHATSGVPVLHVYAATGAALTAAGRPATRFPAGYLVLGLAVDAARGLVYAVAAPSGPNTLVQTAGAGVGGVLVDVWDAAALARGTVTSAYAQPLRVPQLCGQVMQSSFQAALLPSHDGKRLFFGCLTNRALVTLYRGPHPGDVAGVVELDLAAAAAGAADAARIRPVPGNFADGDVVAIPGRHRLVLTANDSDSTSFRVFDLASRYYIGNVGLDDIGVPALGFDRSTGRGYYVVKPGLGVFDAGGVPVTQGVVLEEHAALLGTLTRPVEVDPVRRRVFVPTSERLNVGDAPFVAVLRDELPSGYAAADGELPGLDEPEVPGRTGSSRTSEASAIGAEFRVVGGPAALFANATNSNTGGAVARPGTRYEQFGVARGVRLSADEASAEAVTTRQDEATHDDLIVPGAEYEVGPFAAPAMCNDFGFSPGTAAADRTEVRCDLAKNVASAEASAEPGRILVGRAGHPGALPAPVQVRSASAFAESHREPGLGKVVSTMRAEAHGIDLLGTVRIGRVTATARAEAHGRSGTATTTYERTVTGLVVGGTTVCAADCPLATVQEAVHDAFGGRVRVEFPQPHRVADRKGRLAAVTDDPLRHLERVSFDDVPDDVVTTPAMEVVVHLDGAVASRLLVGLAAVSAQERYRIFKLAGPPPVPGPVPTATPGVSVPRPVVARPGAPVVSATPVVTPPRAAVPGAPPTIVEQLREGLKVVFRSPRQLAAVAALWALLALPAYLAARRRLLVELPFLRRAVEGS